MVSPIILFRQRKVIADEKGNPMKQSLLSGRLAPSNEDGVVKHVSQPEGTSPFSRSREIFELDTLKHLTLTGVKVSDNVLGRGNFGTVYKATYNGIPCAAKRVDSYRLRYWHTKDNHYFVQECLQHSQLEHKNIVKMLGVSYHYDSNVTYQISPKPVLVMELMEYTLTQLMEDDEELFIPMYVKLSILQDVSAGLCYLHNLNPPLAHGGLSSHNVLLTADLVAKLGDFGDTKVVTKSSGSHCSGIDAWIGSPFGISFYNQLPSDVFDFGHLAYYLITQKPTHCPSPHRVTYTLPVIDIDVILFQCCDEMSEGPLKQLIKLCINNCTLISVIHKRIIDITRG